MSMLSAKYVIAVSTGDVDAMVVLLCQRVKFDATHCAVGTLGIEILTILWRKAFGELLRKRRPIWRKRGAFAPRSDTQTELRTMQT